VDTGIATAAMMGVGVATGLVESSMARLRLVHVPQLLFGAAVLATLALVLVLRGRP
jgi:formate hydrogenlyase subunit 4